MKQKKFLLFSCFLIIPVILTLSYTLQAQSNSQKEQNSLSIIKILPFPGPNCQGLTWDGQHLWVSDIVKDSIYQIDTANGNIIHKIPTPSEYCEGLAWDGQYLWASSYDSPTINNPKINKIDPVTGTIVFSFTPMLIDCWPRGLAWDGQNIWENDYHFQQLIQFNPNLGNPLDFIVCPGSESVGLAWFNNSIWIADIITDSIYRINPVTKQIMEQWECPSDNPRDMEFDGQHLWLLAFDTYSIYKIGINISGVNDELDPVTSNFELKQNYPNPFNPSTVISYQLPVSGNVTLKVYDVLGNEIETLVDEYKSAGTYENEFSATSHSGNVRNLSAGRQDLASGIFFYQLRVGKFIETKKMILLK